MAKYDTAVLNTKGQRIELATGMDLTGWEELHVKFRKGDESTTLTISNTTGAPDGDDKPQDSGTPTDGDVVIVKGGFQWDVLGEWKASVRVVKSSATVDVKTDPPGRVIVVDEFQN